MDGEDRRPVTPRLPDAGWLPDPASYDIERYWDGSRWTQRTRDRATGIESGVRPLTYNPVSYNPVADGPGASSVSGAALNRLPQDPFRTEPGAFERAHYIRTLHSWGD